MEEKKDTAPPQSTLNATAEKVLGHVKALSTMTLVGLGLALLFLVFFFIDALAYKWWLMFAVIGGSGFVLYRQYTETTGLEKKICFYTLIALGVLFLLRDIQMSSHMNIYSTAQNAAQNAAQNLEKMLKEMKPK